MPDNRQRPSNPHSVTLGLPKTPTIKMPATTDVDTGNKNMSVNDMFLMNASKVSPKGISDIPISSIYQGNRYDKTRVGTDYEEMAAQQQAALSKIGNDVVKFAGVAGTSFVSGTAGLVYGVGSAIKNQRWAGLIDNDVTRSMDNVMTNLEDQLPNYYTHAEQDAKWYSPDNILTVNFWSDKVLKNLGYSVGALAGGVAWGSVLRGIGLTNRLVQAGKGLEAATAIEESMVAAPKLGKYAAFENTLSSLAQKYVKSPIGAVLTDSDRILTSAMGTFGEASLEGLQGMNKFRNDAIQQYKDTHGFEPTGAELNKINSEADKLGMYIWGANSVLLTATNYIQLPKILGSSRKADKALINKIEQEAVGGEFVQNLPKTTFGRITRATGSTIKALATGKATVLFAPSEAFEEGMQSAIQTGVGNYFKRAYENRDQAQEVITNISDAWGNIFTEGIGETLTSKEGLESILIGGLSGGIQQAGFVGTYKDEQGKTRVGIGKSGLIGEQGLFGLGGERQKNTEAALEKLNKSNIHKALKDQAKFMAIGIGSQKLRQDAIADNDVLSEKDYEQDFALSYVMPRAKYGKIASVNQELDYYKNQAMTDQGFNELVTGGIVNENETREEFIQRIDGLKTLAKNVDGLYSTLNDKYEGLVTENNQRLYSDSAIDKMVYAASKIKDYDARIPRLNESLIKNNIVAQPIIDEVITNGSVENSESYAKALAQINEMDTTDDEKEDLKKSLDDLVEVAGRRKLFIDQYNDIKNNPIKYQDAPDSVLDDNNVDENNVIKIKTKNGESNYVIGKKYFLGEIVEYTDDGHPIFRTPTVKILGKNEDGTIQMYDVATKEVFSASPEKLESYDLQGLDETIANPLAKFTIKNRNTLFQHRGLKDKDGNPRQGRVRYNAEKDILEFYYLDARGKERSKPVTTEQFKKQKDFSVPMIEGISKMTSEQQTSLRELLEALVTDKAAVYRESVEARNKIVKDLYEDSVKRTEEIKRTLERNKEQIEKIAEEIDNSFKTKQGQARKRISKTLQKQIDTLLETKANLEAQNQTLLDEQADLEYNIPFFKSLIDEYSDYEGGSQEFLDQLKSDIKVMEDLVDVTNNAIKENERMIDLIDQLFNRAVDLFNDYIKRVKEEFPQIPISIDQLESNLEKFLGTEGTKQYIKDKLGFTQQVLDLESEILEYEKELDVQGLNNKADQLVKELQELKTGLDDLINRQIATAELLNKFQSFVDEQNKLEEEEKALATSKQRKEELLATEDVKTVQNKRQGAKYEPVAKKPATVIGRATVAPYTGKPHQDRANRFGARLNDFPEGTMFGVYVTKKNQGAIINGLIEHLALEADEVIDEDEVIAMVMVNAEGVPVNEFGEPIAVGENLIDNAIYQVFPKGELQWSEKYGGGSMFREGTPENVVDRVTKMYGEWRNSVLEMTELGDLHTVNASFGIPEFVLDAEGNPDFSVRNTVQEAGLMTQDDLETKQMITIPKLETDGAKGLTKYANAIGKVFLNLANSIVPLQNKKHTRQEAKAIFDAILQLAKYANDPTVELTDPEPTRVLTFLKSVVYWGIPIDSQQNKKPAGYNSIFFETDVRGKMMLTISNEGLDFSFTPTSLLRQEEEVIEAIMNIHNNINSLMASKINDSYEQILSINEEGEIESIIWPNYQSYLLSDKSPGEDRALTQPRDKESIPLTTAMRAVENEEDVNRRGIYFYTTDNADDYTFAEEKKKRTVQAKAKKAATRKKPSSKSRAASKSTATKERNKKSTRNTKSTSKSSPFYKNKKKTSTRRKIEDEYEDDVEEETTSTKKGRIVIDGKTINTYTFPIQGGKTVQYVVHPSVSASNLNKSIYVVEGEEDYDEVVAGFKKAGANPGEQMRKAIFKAIEKQQSNEEVDEEDEYIDDEIDDIFGNVVVGGKTKSKKPVIDDTDEEPEFSNKSKKILKDLFDNEDEDDDIAMRERILNEESPVETEDWDEIAKWLKVNFPWLPVYRLKNIIQFPNGKQAWGILKDNAIYLYENAEVGTTYHEVFEAVWKLFSDPKEQEAIRNEFRNREGSFIDRPSQKSVKYSEATDHQIKEQLAEEFRDYIKDKKIPPKPKDGRPYIVKLFSDIWTTIKNFFLGRESTNNTERLFEKIGTGYYAKNTKFKSSNSFNDFGFIDKDSVVASEDDDAREKLIIDDKRKSEIIEHMTYETLLELTKNDQNLFADPSINKAVMYDNIKEKLQKRIGKKILIAKKLYEEGEITKRKRNELIKDSIKLIDAIDDRWDELIDKHEEFLRGYNVEFDENDELQLNDDDQIKESDKFDATKIDAFKKANRAIKLLLSTIPYVDEEGRLDPSSINGARLIPVSQVNITLLNNLSSARNTDEMIENLRKLAEDDVNYRTLYKRLVKQDYSEENPSLDKIKSSHASQMIAAFWKLFKKYNSIVKMVSVLDNGEVVVKNSYLSNAAEQIRRDYVDAIIVSARSGAGFFRYDKNKKVFVGQPLKLLNTNLTNKTGMVKFLSQLGIDFTTQELNKLEANDSKTYDLFKDAVGGIKKSISNKEAIATFTGKTLNIGKRLYQLAEIKAKISNPEVDSTFFNINGDMTQSHIGPNVPSQLFEFLSDLEKFDAANVGSDPQFSYLITDNFAKGSVILKRMFNINNKGEKRETDKSETESLFAVGYSGGYENAVNGKSKPSSKLNYRERLIEELNMNLAGWYNNLVPGDSSLSHIVYLGNETSYEKLTKGMSDINLVFKDYFISEVLVSKERNRPFVEVEGRKRTDLRFFKSILGKELHQEVVEFAKSNTAEDTYKKFEGKINSALNTYINEKNNSLKKTLGVYNILKESPQNEEGFIIENVALPQNISDKQVDLHLKALTINYMIANIELHKLLYSDPYQYSDELKRTKSFNSPRQLIVGGKDKINNVFNRVWNNGFDKDDIGYTDFIKPYFRTVSFKDIISYSSLLNYGTFKETDGSGIILFKSYRNFRIRAGEWNDNEEKQYRYDIAWEKRHKAQIAEANGEKELANKIYKTISYEESELLDGGNPKVQSAYTALKPIVSGNKADGRPFNDVILDKFALYPLSYRVMVEMNADSNSVKLHEKLQRENIDYIIFDSARKVGAVNSHQPYINGEFNDAPFIEKGKDRNIVNVPFEILSVQSDVPSKEDGLVRRGTQPTKLITMDFLEAGIPVDFMEKDDFAERYEKWYKLSEDDKKENSSLYKEIKNNQELLEVLIEKGYNSLLKSLGIEENGNKYVVDLSEAGVTLRNEVLKQHVNDNISDALKGFLNGKVSLEATPAYQQVRNILYSIASREVISPKVSGGLKVQIPVSFLEDGTKIELVDINGKKGYESDSLAFYSEEKNKEGKRVKVNVCEIMVGRWFDSNKTDAELLKYLNETEEGQKILSGLAYRIPTQKQNSIDVFRIKQFLPKEFGDSVVIPSALVKKVGSDFDIDKLSIYLKNVKIGKDGYPKYIKLLNDSNSTVEERYYEWVLENSKRDTRNYIQYLTKGMVSNIRKEFASKFNEISEKYRSDISYKKEQLYIEHNKLVDDVLSKDVNLTEQEKYLQELFNKSRDVFFSLSNEEQTDYFLLRDEMRRNSVNGPIELQNYLTLTLGKLETISDEEDRDTLNDLVTLYTEQLRVLGAKDEYLKEFNKKAIELFRNRKIIEVGKILQQRTEIADQLREEEQELTMAHKMQVAEEISTIDNLTNIEEFKKMSILSQNTKKAVENEFIQSGENLVSHPKNYDRLIQPNSADQLKKLSGKIAKVVSGKTFEYSNVGNMLDRMFMTSLRHAFVTGKYAIGIAAVNQTNHSLNQRQLIFIDRSKLKEMSQRDAYWLDDASIKFNKYNKIRVGNRIVTTLSMIKNAERNKEFPEGQDISDIIGQFIDGYVDISAGPWIMEFGATPNVASTWLFLVKVGVPIDDIAYFMNQPIIRDYLRSIENAGYSYLFMQSFMNNTLFKFSKNGSVDAVKLNQARKNFKIPNAIKLEKSLGIDPKDMDNAQLEEQQIMLMEFLKYAKMAEQMFHLTQGTNFDTANFNDPTLVYKKQMQLDKARKTIISSTKINDQGEEEIISAADAILDNSFLGELAKRIGDIRNALSTILVSDQKKVRGVIQKVIAPYIDKNDREFVKIAQKAVNDFFDWAVQCKAGDNSINRDISKILIRRGGIGKEVLDFVSKIKKDKNHPLHNNHVIKILEVKPSARAEEGGPTNIKIKGLDNKVYDQNNIIHAFREIRNYLEDMDQSKPEARIYDKIKLLAVLQSGLSTSPISFTSVIPYEDFEDMYDEIISKIETIPNIDDFYNLGVYQRNNYNNDDTIPYKKATWVPVHGYNLAMKFLPPQVKNAIKSNTIPQVLTQSIYNREAQSDYMVYSWEDQLPAATKKKMREIGDYSYINKGLFKKVYNPATGLPFVHTYTNDNGDVKEYFVYKAINAWGDSFRANEFYDHERKSVINNGFIKVDETQDEEVVRIFKQKRKATISDKVKNAAGKKSKEDIIKGLFGDLDEETSSNKKVPKGDISRVDDSSSDKIARAIGNIFGEQETETEEKEISLRLKDGKVYPASKINSKMLIAMGHTPLEAGKILNKIC